MKAIGEEMKVRGTAIVAGVSRNKIKYTEEELKKGSSSLKGITIIKDHQALTDNSIGRVESQKFNENTQSFGGWVKEDGTGITEKIKDKRVRVSVGATVKKLIKESENSDVMKAVGIRYVELSTTPTPGVGEASIDADESETCNITESFDSKQLKSNLTFEDIDVILSEIEEEIKMAEEPKPEESTEEIPEEAPEEKKVEPESKPEEETPEPESKPEEKEHIPVEKKDEATEMLKTLVKENIELKKKLGDIPKVTEEKKMKKDEIKSMKDHSENITKEFEGYVLQESEDSIKTEFFKMPKSDGTY